MTLFVIVAEDGKLVPKPKPMSNGEPVSEFTMLFVLPIGVANPLINGAKGEVNPADKSCESAVYKQPESVPSLI